jgi:hypothetical protein
MRLGRHKELHDGAPFFYENVSRNRLRPVSIGANEFQKLDRVNFFCFN